MVLHRSRRLVLKEYDCVERFAAMVTEGSWLFTGELPAEAAVDSPDGTFTGLYPWQWAPAGGEAFIDDMCGGESPIVSSTARRTR